MSKIRLNEEQQQFVNALGGNVLVSASAGSGKTSTMIYKLLNLISDGVSVNEILVLTFTDAAAGEMKQRLYTGLINLAQDLESEIDVEKNAQTKEMLKQKLKNIYESVENITYADIGTFHSTFKKIITKYFYHLELDPAFSLLNAQEQNILLMQSLTDVFDKYILSKDESFYNLQEVFNKNRRDTAFKEILLDLFYMSQEKPNFNNWFNNTVKESFNKDVNNNKIANYLFNKFKSEIISFKEKFVFYLNFAIDNEWGAYTKYLESCNSIINKVYNSKNFEEFFNSVANSKIEGQRRAPTKPDESFYEILEEIKLQTAYFKDLFDDVKKQLVFNDINAVLESFELSENYLLKLKEVLDNVVKTYENKKMSKSQLDFNDLQTKMLTLLQINIVKNEIQNSYKHIFVDEFQDVNEIQYSILELISSGNNLNMIGDVKQSIYEFRLASPDIFINKFNEFNKNSKSGRLVQFNKNYRSSKNILEFVNSIFNEIITVNTVGINYKDTSKLVAGNESLVEFDNELSKKGVKNIKLTIVNTGKLSEEEDDESENSHHDNPKPSTNEEEDQTLSAEEVEANAVVNEINWLLGKPFYNAKTGREEFITYKDIAVLTRSGGKFITQLQKVLNKFKIPSVLSVKNKIFNTYEVSVLFSYMQLISNHLNDYALATAMLSKIGGFKHNDLAKIRLFDNSKKAPFYNAVLGFKSFYLSTENNSNNQINSENENKLDTTCLDNHNLAVKIKSFFENISYFRQSLQTDSVYDVLIDVLNKFDLINHFKSMPDGDFKVNNIEEFLKLIKVDLFKHNITYIVDYLTQLSEKDDFNVNMPSVANSVTILTMHKSKGLEYPAVILADLGKKFNTTIKAKDIAISQNLGMGIKLKNPETRVASSSLQFSAVALDKLESELKENIRLFYVATTRAKNYLSLVGRYKAENILSAMDKHTMSAKNFLELLFVALKPHRQVFKKYLLKGELSAEYVVNENKQAEFLLKFVEDNYALSALDANDENSVIIPKQTNNVLLNELTKRFDFEYEVVDSVAIKNSVTSLLQEQDYVLANNSSKAFKTSEINTDSGISLEIGVLYHSIMQKIDYVKHTSKDIENIVNAAIANSSNPPQMQKRINFKQIEEAVFAVKNIIKDGYLSILKEQQFILQDNYNNLIANSNITQKVIVQGVIDLIVEFDDHVLLIDFKTNKGINENQFKNIYGLQLNLYEKAIKHVYKNKPVLKYIYSFELQRIIIV